MKLKKSNQVFEIIRKLDKGEKRGFNIHASAYETKAKAIITLFNIIYDYTHALPDEAEPNENDILAQLKKEKLHARYATIKRRLKNELMDFLSYRMSKTDEFEQIKNKLPLAIMLIQRGIYTAGFELLREVRAEAEEYEMYETLLTIFNTERVFLSHDLGGWDEKMRSSYDETGKVIGLYTELINATYMTERLRKSRLLVQPLPADIDTIDQLLDKIKNSTSACIRHEYYLMLGMLSQMQEEPAVTLAHEQAHIEMLGRHMKPVGKDVMRYFIASLNHVKSLLRTNELVKAAGTLRTIESKYMIHSKRLSDASGAYINLNIYRYNIEYAKLKGDKKLMLNYLEEAERYFLKDMKLINSQGIAVFYMLLRNGYFFCGQYSVALKWIVNKIMDADMPQHVVLSGHIIQLMCSYELAQDATSLRAIIKRIRYYLDKDNVDIKIRSFIEAIITSISTLSSARNAKEKTTQMLHMRSIAQGAMDSSDVPLRALIDNSNIIPWLAQKG